METDATMTGESQLGRNWCRGFRRQRFMGFEGVHHYCFFFFCVSNSFIYVCLFSHLFILYLCFFRAGGLVDFQGAWDLSREKFRDE